MNIIICPTAEAASLRAADMITEAVRKRPETVLGLATGSTPTLLYKALIQAHRDGLDFSRVRTFNLDEYHGLAPDHPQSYRRFMEEQLFNHLNLDLANTHVPDGLAKDVAAHCAAYEAEIKAAGGIDIQVLGIGSNGHIGFNEPASSLVSRTRLVALTQQTISDNARFFDAADEVPRHAISMGIGTILEAKRCIMLCFGEHKAKAVRAAIEGGVSQFTPASALQMHPDTTVFLDEAAAADLELKEYYRWSAANQPA
ncbi:MAG: glucosamine-6-phosphate deaminase [Kiritimatiellae bacterium]|jgi:glucosamine-6-phosphate deaminase|nr:glucosamine-6-phosphate deaminase [Kiritimatiellia bacterium]HHU16548.1 glucosamine-6-phosphate deaminase [Lentisphaerota bacterium]MDD2348049.1 glucosamine-6-phosphate deaminase [Kiritimatiellia bacterium]HON46419.1 glucosamine-6-phosphate deaminase [Kiritimatiellia bacterium]HQA39106.1 glucosamine-6-phosphate deaminase [Kiritimatiellia bacterium]